MRHFYVPTQEESTPQSTKATPAFKSPCLPRSKTVEGKLS